MHYCIPAFALILIAGQANPPTTDDEPRTGKPFTPPAVVSREQRTLADRVARAYRDAGYLSYRMEVTAEPYHLIAKCRMAPGKLKTTVYAAPPPESDEDPHLLAMFVFRDGVMKEYRSKWHAPGRQIGYRDVVVEYPARFTHVDVESGQWIEDANGTPAPVLDDETDCLIGSPRTWLGPTAPKPEYHRKVIETGSVLDAPMEVDGSPCWVVTWEPDRGDYVRRDVFYFDRDSLMLRKWDTLESDKPDPPQLTRSRKYTRIELRAKEPDDAHLWEFDIPTRRRDAAND